jgi:hypothetical protein
VEHTCLDIDGSQFAEAEQNGFVFSNVVGALIRLIGEIESFAYRSLISKGDTKIVAALAPVLPQAL